MPYENEISNTGKDQVMILLKQVNFPGESLKS